LAAVKAYYHLDAGVGHRYLIWLGNVARLNFGTSITTNQPVGSMLLAFGTETLKLQIPAIILALLSPRSPLCGNTAGWISA
jgi:ABC-type dipeptide/oligopeptide/nickel transport system permease component